MSNFLKGRHGDHANAVLTAVGYNLRLILSWLRILCAKIMVALYDAARRIFASHEHSPLQI